MERMQIFDLFFLNKKCKFYHLLCAYMEKIRPDVNIPFQKVGTVARNEVKIGVSSFYATQHRGEVADFSTILDYTEY